MRLLMILFSLLLLSCAVGKQFVVCRITTNLEEIRSCAERQIPSSARIIAIKKTTDPSVYEVRYIQ